MIGLKVAGKRTMSVLTIVEASKQFNVTRPRIYRAINKGELTTALNDEGVQVVQVQDMVRLFGSQNKKAVPKSVRNSVPDTDSKLVQLLEEQLRKAEEDKTFLKQQINDLRKDFDDYKLRIEHHPNTDQRTDVTRHEHLLDEDSLQIEQPQNMTEKSVKNIEDSVQQDKPTKKSLFSRLVREILK